MGPLNPPAKLAHQVTPTMLRTIKRPKLRDVVTDHLKRYIQDERLKPGDRLPTETELADRLGVSRLSLREATKALEFLGIVEAKPGRGLTVGRMDMDRVTACLGFHPALQDANPQVLIDTRIVIETGILPSLAQRMGKDASIHTRLSAINAELKQAKTLQRWTELDLAFHRCLLESSGLAPLMAFSDVLAAFFRRFRESVKKAEWSGGVACHQQIIDELRAGRVEKAGQCLRSHIESHKLRAGDSK